MSGARCVREAADMGRTWQPAVDRVEIFAGGAGAGDGFSIVARGEEHKGIER